MSLTDEMLSKVYGHIPCSSRTHAHAFNRTCTLLPYVSHCTITALLLNHESSLCNRPHLLAACTPWLSALPRLPLPHTQWAVHGRRLASGEGPGRPTHGHPTAPYRPPPLLPTSHLQDPHPSSCKERGESRLFSAFQYSRFQVACPITEKQKPNWPIKFAVLCDVSV